MKKCISLLLATSLICSTGQIVLADSDASSDGKQVITIAYNDASEDYTVNHMYQWLMQAYEGWDKKDQVELDIQPVSAGSAEYLTKVELQMTDASTCPDLFYEDTFQLGADVAAGYLANLDAYEAEWEAWNNGEWFEATKQATAVDGVSYGVPIDTDTRGLWYDKQIFVDAGLLSSMEESWQPSTWEEILDACRTIKENCPDVCPFWDEMSISQAEGTSMDCYEMLLYGTGETLLDEEGNYITDSQGIADSLTFLQTIVQEGLTMEMSELLDSNSYSFAMEYMQNHQLGIMLNGNWVSSSFRPEGKYPMAEDYTEVLGFALMPTQYGDGTKYITMSGGWSWAIPELSDQKDLTFEFVTELMKPENYIIFLQGAGTLAVRDMSDIPEYIERPFTAEVTEAANYANYRPHDERYSSVSTYIYTMVEAVVTGTSIEDAMAEYADGVSAIN